MSISITVRQANFLSISEDTLTDIRDVDVSKDLSKKDRIAEFINQMKNPYIYKCGKFIVNSKYTKNGFYMEDQLRSVCESKCESKS